MSSVLVDIQKVDKKYTLGGNVFGAQKRIIHAVKNVDLQIIRGKRWGWSANRVAVNQRWPV